MAITILFTGKGVKQEQYDGVIRDLEAAGASAPSGRKYHVASALPDGWCVVDVWDSQTQFERFAQTLVPLLKKHQINMEPQFLSTHNIIVGES
jgi:hypothetical protein